jgi:hypothetical protein
MGMSATNANNSSSTMPPGNNGATMPMPMPMAATFDSIQANIFTPKCASSSCHGGATPAANLALDALHSYGDLINIPSTEKPSEMRVKPGSAMESFLVQHMQNGADGASQTDLSFIVQWITDGAAPDMAAMMMASPFQVAAVQPEAGAIMKASPPRVIVSFSHELDASRADSASVELERVEEGDGVQPATSMIPAVISIPDGNARALLVTPSSALPAGQFQVVLDMTPGAEIGSIVGETLAEPAGGIHGERIVTRFSVAGDP